MSVADYRFAAEPRTVKNSLKYREEEADLPTNMMYDRRIVRGNTYAAMIVPDSSRLEIERRERLERAYRARISQKHREAELKEEGGLDQQRESPANHEEETEFHYEELKNETNSATATQSNFFVDSPPKPDFLPTSEGVNRATQIEFDEIFDFDVEVNPILDVIIGKTIEQARIEVLEEDEQHAFVTHRNRFIQERNAELIEIQRIQEQDIRVEKEKERRTLQCLHIYELMTSAHQKYVSRIIAKRFIKPLLQSAVTELEEIGPFADPDSTCVHDTLLPWIVSQTNSSVNTSKTYDQIQTEIMFKSCTLLKQQYRKAMDKRLEDIEQAKEAVLQAQRDTEKRRAERVLMRIKREEERKRQEFEEQVYSLFVEKASKIRNSSTQLWKDIDDFSSEKAIAVPGGRTGELINLFARIEEIQGVPLNQSQVNEIVQEYATSKVDALACSVNEDAFNTLCETLQSTAFHELEEDKQKLLQEFLLNPDNGEHFNTLAHMRANPEIYKFRKELFNMYYRAIFAMLTAKNTVEDEEEVENPIRKKVLLKKVSPGLPPEERMAVVKIVLTNNDDEEEEGNKSETRSKAQSSSYREPEDRTLLLSHTNEGNFVYIVNLNSLPIIRRDLSKWVRKVRGFANINSEQLFQKMMETGDEYLNKRLEEFKASSQYTFEFPAI